VAFKPDFRGNFSGYWALLGDLLPNCHPQDAICVAADDL
jgi:hypothetical protein